MQLRWYQQEAVDSVFESLANGRGNPLVDLPTGSGKSLVIGEATRKAVEDFQGRVVVLAHRKELLQQNAAKIQSLANCSVGVYSAGLGKREVDQDVIVGGIQSIYKNAHELGRRHLVLIDEAHLTPKSEDGMYRKFLSDLQRFNPRLKVAGLTATPFRLDSGKLWGDGELFSHVSYRGDIRRLIDEGYLCKLVTPSVLTNYDTSGLHIRGGEFVRKEVELLFGDDYLLSMACNELVEIAKDRKSILVFASGVDHAENVRNKLEQITGERVECVTGETPDMLRASILDAFGKCEFRYCVNVDVLTTGFDSPRIDCVAIMRATQSAGLFCQIVGRGLRIHPSKQDCIVVDFGGNLKRHGPIDSVDFGAGKKRGEAKGDAPQKECPGCMQPVAVSVRTCECGFRFPVKEASHDETADTQSQILSEPEVVKVTDWAFSRHVKRDAPDKPNSLRVTYILEGANMNAVEEWVCLMHDNLAGKKAARWWADHCDITLSEGKQQLGGDLIDVAIELESQGFVRMPVELTVVRDGKWWRVKDRVIGEPRQPVPASDWDLIEDEDIPF